MYEVTRTGSVTLLQDEADLVHAALEEEVLVGRKQKYRLKKLEALEAIEERIHQANQQVSCS